MLPRRLLGRLGFAIALVALSTAPSADASCGVPSLRDLARSADQLLLAEVEAHGRDANELHSHLLLRTIETFKGSPPERQWVELAYGAEGAPAIRGERYLVALYKRATPLVFDGGSANLVLDACAMLPMRVESMPHRVRQLRRWGWAWRHTPRWMYETTYHEPWLTVNFWGADGGATDAFSAEVDSSGAVLFFSRGKHSENFFKASIPPPDMAELRALVARDFVPVRIDPKPTAHSDTRRIQTVEGSEIYVRGELACEDEDVRNFVKLWNEVLTVIAPLPRAGRELRVPDCQAMRPL